MADNTQLNTGTGGDIIGTDELTYSGDTAKIPLSRLVHVTGSEGSKTLHEYVFAEDAAHSSGDYGFQFLAVRTDTPANKSGADGDYEPLQLSAGRLWVSATVTAVVPGTAATNLGKAVDSAAGGTDTGVAPLAIRDDSIATLTPVDGDYVNLRVNARGALWTELDATYALHLISGQTGVAGGSGVDGANVLRVSLATDVALPAGTNAIGKLSANSGVDIGDVDVTSVVPGTAATNPGKAIDSAGGATDTGVAALVIRDDALTTLTPADGDYVALRTDSVGAGWTHTYKVGSVVDSTNSTTTPLGGSGTYTGTAVDLLGYSAVCITVHADVDSGASGMKFQFSSDGTNWDDSYDYTFTASEGTARRFQFPICARYFRFNYTNGAGAQSTFRVQTILHTANQLTSIHRAGDDISPDRSAQLVKSILVAQAAGSGDFTPTDATAGGNLKVSVEEQNAAFEVVGSVAHDAADAGNPQKIGAKAETSLSGITLVADGDRTDLHAGVDGVLITRNHCNLEDQVQERDSNTDGASTAFGTGLAAPGAGVRLWITKVTFANSSSTDLTVDLRDGAAGSVLWTTPVPANGGALEVFDPPLKLTANTALAYDGSAAASTLYISAIGFKSKV